MITLEKAKSYVEAEAETFSVIEVDERGYLRARLETPASLDITLIVHPIEDALLLRLRAMNIGQIELGQAHEQVLRRCNAAIELGRVAWGDDGEVIFEVNHPCLDGDVDDPGPEVFERLLRATASTARDIARIVMTMRLTDSRLPQLAIDKLIADTFGQADDTEDNSEDAL